MVCWYSVGPGYYGWRPRRCQTAKPPDAPPRSLGGLPTVTRRTAGVPSPHADLCAQASPFARADADRRDDPHLRDDAADPRHDRGSTNRDRGPRRRGDQGRDAGVLWARPAVVRPVLALGQRRCDWRFRPELAL